MTERSHNFGPFRSQDEIGTGRFGRVTRAVHQGDGKLFALKMPAPNTSGADFLAHISIFSEPGMQHPHILKPAFTGVEPNYPFYAMPLADRSLAALLAEPTNHGGLPYSDTKRVAAAITSALAHAHRHGLVHRNLHPNNIVRVGGQWMLSDFSIGAADVRHVVHHIAPEVLNGAEVSAASDVYAIASILYKCITGYSPFGGDDEAVAERKRSGEVPLEAWRSRSDCPKPVADALAAAFLPISSRISLAELANAMTGLPADSPQGAGAPTKVRSAGRKAVKTHDVPSVPTKKRPRAVYAGVAATLAIAAGAVFVPRMLEPAPSSTSGATSSETGITASTGTTATSINTTGENDDNRREYVVCTKSNGLPGPLCTTTTTVRLSSPPQPCDEIKHAFRGYYCPACKWHLSYEEAIKMSSPQTKWLFCTASGNHQKPENFPLKEWPPK